MFRFKWRWGLLAIVIAALFLGSNTVTQTTAKASVSPAVMQEQLAIGIDVNDIAGDTQVAQGRIAGSYETFVAGNSNDQTNTTPTVASVGNTVGLSHSSPVAASGSGSVSSYNYLRDTRLAWEVLRYNKWVVMGQCGPINGFATMIATRPDGDIVDSGSDNVGPWTTTGTPDTNMATVSARSLAWLGGFSDYGGAVPQVGYGNTMATLAATAAGTGTTFSDVANV